MLIFGITFLLVSLFSLGNYVLSLFNEKWGLKFTLKEFEYLTSVTAPTPIEFVIEMIVILVCLVGSTCFLWIYDPFDDEWKPTYMGRHGR